MAIDITQRKLLRDRLLKELYDYHFSGTSNKPKPIAEEIKDIEYRNAYLYLEDKSLVELVDFSHTVFAAAKINAYGIDEVEKKI